MIQISARRVLSLVVLMGVVVFLIVFSNYEKISFEKHPRNNYAHDLKDLISQFDNLNGLYGYLNQILDAREQEVLLKTLQFQLNHTKAEDEQLVAFVRSLVHPPFPASERNLSDKARTDFSQIGQSKYIDGLLGSRRDGFFVEAGGYNGEDHSNSLFFELNRNWEGILIEPNNTNFNKIISKKRRTYALNACITDKVTVAKFIAFEYSALSGLDSLMSDHHRKRGKTGQVTFVPCFSLVTILKAINVNKVDYFSLDVEGGESFVLKAIDFSKVDIKSLTIEHNNEKEHLDSIVNIMKDTKLYKETDRNGQDIYYAKL
jgi:FkbM family methyltransferase